MFQKYYEAGYTLIPLKSKDKNPIIQDWTRWCREQATEELVQKWQENFSKNHLNVGIPCGKSNGIIGLDIDTNDKEIIKLFPQSPVARRGRSDREGVRFFKYNENIKSQNFPYGEILSDGRQSVLPPSIHPLTGEGYTWVTPYTLLDYRAEDLPELDLSFLEKLTPISKHSQSAIVTGRNNKIVDIITSMRYRGESETKIAHEIYSYDKLNHTSRLFIDKDEGYKAMNEDDALRNAFIMVNNVTKTIIKNIPITTLDESVKEISNEEIEKNKKESFKYKPYPKARGMMKDFQDICNIRSSSDNQDGLSLGAAIAMMSILASNKFVTECAGMITCPNIYILNLAYSSFGKGLAQDILNTLLLDSGLLGSSNYKSDTSILMGLPQKQEMLIVNDESSSFLKNIGGKESYNSSMVELLCELFSKSSSKFGGVASVNNGMRFGACWNPHLSFIGSTTPNGFRNSVNKDIAAKGLMPRFILFQQFSTGKWNGRKDKSAALEIQKRLQEKVNKILAIDKIVHPDFEPFVSLKNAQGDKINDNSEGTRYLPKVMHLTQSALDLWFEYDERFFNEKAKNPEGFESAFVGRFAEIALKIALCDALSLDCSFIDADSIEWAFEVVQTCWYNSVGVYELAHAENRDEADVIRILTFIKKHGVVSRKNLITQNRWIKSKALNDIIGVLKESGQIDILESETAGRKALFYKILSK